MYERKDERKGRTNAVTAYLLAIVLLLGIVSIVTAVQQQIAYAQNPPGQISGSGSGQAVCPANGAQGQADIDFDATYDPDTGQVQNGGSITVTGSPEGAGMSSVHVTGGQVVDNGDQTGQFSITGSITRTHGACDGPPTTGITTLTGECGENQVFTLSGDVSGQFQGSVDCGLAEEEPEPEPPLNEQFPDQGSCLEGSKDPDAGFTKDDCKDAFKDKKVKPTAPTTSITEEAVEKQEAAPEVEDKTKDQQQQQEEQEKQQQEEQEQQQLEEEEEDKAKEQQQQQEEQELLEEE